MNKPVKYDSLVIDPDLDTRMRLKTAMTSVHQFQKVFLLGTLREGDGKMDSGDPWDVVFISYKIPKDEITAFIKNSKEKKNGQGCCLHLDSKTDDQDSSTVAQNVMIGADGFLFEPYSVDQLVEITDLAARVKRERSQSREQAALSFLLKDVMEQLDIMAYLKSVGYDVGTGIRRFKQMCNVFQTLEPESKEIYYNLAIDMFEAAPFPKKIYQKSYSGASSRVKKRMEEKLLKQLEGEMVDKGPDEASASAE